MSGPITPWGQVPAGRYELYADDDDVIGLTVATTYPSGWPIVRTDPPFMDACDEFAIGQFIAAALTNTTAPEGDVLAELRAVREAIRKAMHENGRVVEPVVLSAMAPDLLAAVDRLLASHTGGDS